MTRPKDRFWEYAERLIGGRFKCIFCERNFAGGVPRIKSHLSGIKGRDIDICTKVPRDVQLDAAAAINKGVNKRAKTEAFSSNSDETSSEVCEKNDSSMQDRLLAKFILLNNIDSGVVNSQSFIEFVTAVAAYGVAYNLPSYSTLKTVVIPGLLGEVEAHVNTVKESWGESGCTLISDVWCDEKEHRSFVNIFASSWKGVVLVNAFEIPKRKLTSDFLDVILRFSIQKVGANNVVQYINGAQSVGPAGSLHVKDYPHIYVTRCVAAEIQSLFEEVCDEIKWVQVAFDEVRYLVSRLHGHNNFLSLMRKYTNNREFRQPNTSEFSSNYDMILSITEVRTELLQLVQSPEWLSFGYDRHELGKEITEMIHSSEFWNQGREIVMALEPLRLVLYLVDRYGSSSGNFYVVMEMATEKMRRVHDVDPTKYQRLWDIFSSRKDEIVQPIHAAAAFLNPAYMCTGMFSDKAKVSRAMNFVVSNLVAEDDQKAFVEQMVQYDSREPELFSGIAKIMLETSHPCKWWDYCGHQLPVLRKYAIRILSQPSSSSACKQSLSAFGSAQIKQQQRFALEPCDQLPLRMNMILADKLSSRNTSDKPIDLSELKKLKFDKSLSNNSLNEAGLPYLKSQPSHRGGFDLEQYPSKKHLQLQFVTKISPFQLTGQEVKGEDESPIHVFLVDPVTGDVVQDDRSSMLKLTVSALQGDFDEKDRNDWTREDFEENEINTDVPLMTGDLQVTIKKGMGTLGAFVFNYDSTIARSGKFRLGIKTVTGDGQQVCIHEGISNAFVVEDVDVTRRNDAAANQTRLPENSPSPSTMCEQGPLCSPQHDFAYTPPLYAYDPNVFDDPFYDPLWGGGIEYKHKQKDNVKLKQAAMRWLKLRVVLQWAILRRIIVRKRAHRMAVWIQAQKRLEEWSEGVEWTSHEHRLFILGQELGQHDRRYISEKDVASTTPTKVASYGMSYIQYMSTLGIDTEESHRKGEWELIKPTGSSTGGSPNTPSSATSQPGHLLTLFPSLLSKHSTERTADHEKDADKMVPEQSETMISTDSNAGESALPNPDRSCSSKQLTLFPSLLAGHDDEIVEDDFVMVSEPEPDRMLSMNLVEVNEPNSMSELMSMKEMHHLTADVTHIRENSVPSRTMDWEMISWSPPQAPDDGMGISEFENNDHHKIAKGNQRQLSDKQRAAATVWPKLKSIFRIRPLLTLGKFGSQAGEDGEPDEEPSEKLPEAVSSLRYRKTLSILSGEFTDIKLDGKCSLKNFTKIAEEQLRTKTFFALKDLEIATDQFCQENVVGEGGFGVIYRGKLTDGTPVAVKRFHNNFGPAEKEFRAFVETRGHLRHENLVQFLGYCIEGTNRLLVYEYVDNGNLKQWLHGPLHQDRHLTWETRMKICSHVAKAIAYLHEEIEPRVVHRDLKASNILLDGDFNAKLSDFGLFKSLDPGKRVIGTLGYIDPEYATSGFLNERVNVYSFGIVLLEAITGRGPVDHGRPTHETSMVEWVKAMLRSRHPEEVVDPNIETRLSTRALTQALRIALRCIDRDSNKRLKMSEVVEMFKSLESPDPPEDGRHTSSRTENTGTEPRNVNSEMDLRNRHRLKTDS